MFIYFKYFIASLVLCTCFWTIHANAATITASSCSREDVTAAYNLASPGDTISVPPGDCSWSSSLWMKKPVIIKGAGIDNTYIRISNKHLTFVISANTVRVTGFTFDCNYASLGAIGIVNVKSAKDFRIDDNKFIKCGLPGIGPTGYSAIYISGYSYGVIDSNTFDNCNGECIDITSEPFASLKRSLKYGQYTNGTVYIEDNTWNFTNGHTAENAVEGNSGSRYVIRHNTFNFSNGSRINGIISNHETCFLAEGSLKKGDVGSLLMEIYENDIYMNDPGKWGILATQRSGRALIYNNRYHVNNAASGNKIIKVSDLRSGDTGDYCSGAANGRGYSGWCHDYESGYTTEGREFSKTSLTQSLDASQTSVSVASVTDFPTYGGSIIVDGEQIDYTGISGTTLTGITRGANQTTAVSHNSGASVDLLVFGKCLEQINNTYVWGNTSPDGDKNGVWVLNDNRGLPDHNEYSSYDIKSYTNRPNNWQYRNDGTEYSYTPYPYPHPLRIAPSAPQNLVN